MAWPRCRSGSRGSSTASTRSGARSNTTRTARPATCRPGVRLVEASLLREFRADDIVVLLPGRSRQVHRPRDARRRRLDPQPARRDVCGRRLHLDLRLVEAADQLALRAGDVRPRSRRARTASTSRSSSAARAGGRSRRPTPSTSWASTASSRGGASRTDTLDLFRQAIRGEELPRQRRGRAIRRSARRSSSPTSGRPSASSR